MDKGRGMKKWEEMSEFRMEEERCEGKKAGKRRKEKKRKGGGRKE